MIAIFDLIRKVIGSFEGCKLTAYQDSVGIWTIGWGHTGPDIVEGLVWSQQEADDHLMAHIRHICDHVIHELTVPFNYNQLAAFCSLAYNIGLGNFDHSTLLKLFDAGDTQGAADEFPKWNKAKGKVLPGLVNRRRMERELFLTAV